MTPIRVQRSRKKGSVTPSNTKYVGRPSSWGNPYNVRQEGSVWIVFDDRVPPAPRRQLRKAVTFSTQFEAHQFAVDCYEREMFGYRHDGKDSLLDYFYVSSMLEQVEELKGMNLSCWCKKELPCHADVLLRYANAENAAGVTNQ